MKAFLAAVAVTVVVAVGAAFVLDPTYQMSTPERFTTDGARLTDPGSNLVRY